MPRRTAEANKAVLEAWAQERKLVSEGKGTRDWTEEQQKDILERGKAYDDNGKAFEGHHMKSAEAYPEQQGNPQNIQFLTRKEHLEAHGGSFQNPTNGYFDPITKLTREFGIDEIEPCKVIELSKPLMGDNKLVNNDIKESIDNGEIKDVVEKDIATEGKLPKKELTQEVVKERIISASIEGNPKSVSGFADFIENAREVVERSVNLATKFYLRHKKEIHLGLKIAGGLIVLGKSLSKAPNSGDGIDSGNSNNNEILDDNGEALSVDENVDDDNMTDEDNCPNLGDNACAEKRAYTPNDVPAGRQRYRYKDGSVRERDRAPYHRGGKKEKSKSDD